MWGFYSQGIQSRCSILLLGSPAPAQRQGMVYVYALVLLACPCASLPSQPKCQLCWGALLDYPRQSQLILHSGSGRLLSWPLVVELTRCFLFPSVSLNYAFKEKVLLVHLCVLWLITVNWEEYLNARLRNDFIGSFWARKWKWAELCFQKTNVLHIPGEGRSRGTG